MRILKQTNIFCFSLLLVLLVFLGGCETMSGKSELGHKPTGPVPTYNELVTRYNANLQNLDRLWSRSVVEIKWWDADGKKHFEQGDGNLVTLLPDKTAISIGKLGNVLLWAGSDVKCYWFFDLKNEGLAYVGQHALIGSPTSKPLPMPMAPRQVVQLLGIVKLPLVQPGAEQPRVTSTNEGYQIEPPGTTQRIVIDPLTMLAVRVELLEGSDETTVSSELTNPQSIAIQGKPLSASPRMATKVRILSTSHHCEITLFLSDMTDGKEEDKINPLIFDFQYLVKMLKPREVVELDSSASSGK